MPQVDVVVDTGWAAVTPFNKSIGTQGANGTCIAVAGILTDGRNFAAHISFGRNATKELCGVFWNGLEIAGIRFREIKWNVPGHFKKHPPTSLMLEVMQERFGRKQSELITLDKDGKPVKEDDGSIYLTREQVFKKLKHNYREHEQLTGNIDNFSICAQIGR